MWELFYFKILFIFFWGWIKRGRETSMCDCLSCAPYWGPGPQPRHVPWLGIEPVTLGFSGWCSVHWATRARADGGNFYKLTFNCCQPHFPCKLRRIIQHLNQGLFSHEGAILGLLQDLEFGVFSETLSSGHGIHMISPSIANNFIFNIHYSLGPILAVNVKWNNFFENCTG